MTAPARRVPCWAAAVFALALLARLAFLFLVDQPLLFQHQYTYFGSAMAIAEHRDPLGYVLRSDEWRTWDQHWTIAPLYHLFAAGVFLLLGPHLLPLQLLQCAFDALVAVGVAALGRRVAGPGGGWAGAAYAVYWPAVELPSWTLTENLHTLLLVSGCLLVADAAAATDARAPRARLLAAGVLLGLSALARSVSSAFVGLLGLLLLWRKGLRRGLPAALLLGAGAAAWVLPWIARNVSLGQPPTIETAAYENLWWASRFGDAERYRRQQDVVFAQKTPEAQRAAALHFAIKNVRERPGLFLDKVRDNFWHLLRPDWLDSLLRVERPGPAWQYAAGLLLEDLLLVALVPPFLLFLLAGRTSPARDVIVCWTAYYVFMIVVVFHNEIRYRSALIPFALAAAAGGIALLRDAAERRRWRVRGALALGLWLSAAMLWPYAGAAWQALAAAWAVRPALAAVERGDLPEAARGVAAASLRDTRSGRPWLQYGRRLAHAGHTAEAVPAYRRGGAVARPGAAWVPKLVLPRLLAETGDAEQAARALREADAFSWSLDPWLALEIAWAELPPPRSDEIRLGLGQSDYGAVRGFFHPRGDDPAFTRRYLTWNRYEPPGPQPPPGAHRWTRHRAWLRLVPTRPAPRYRITLEMGAPFPSTLAAPEVEVRVNDGPGTRFTLTSEIRPYSLTADARPGQAVVVRLDAPTWCRAGEPAEQGVRVDRLRVEPE